MSELDDLREMTQIYNTISKKEDIIIELEENIRHLKRSGKWKAIIYNAKYPSNQVRA